jgi:hypothetical protein
MENDISRIHDELEEAPQSLHQTVADVHQKVETVSAQLQPRHLVERHLPMATRIAGALGFAAGNNGRPAPTAFLLGGLLGAMLREVSGDGFWKRDSTRRP